MNFKKVFRGYDPIEVDKHLAETANKEQQIRTAQKERIDELLEENRVLRKRVSHYEVNEQAISQALIDSHKLADEVKLDAEKYSNLVLNRAKIFCASWRAYSKTLVAALSDEEVREFNFLQRKIENMINAYEGKQQDSQVAAAKADERQNDVPFGVFSNPIVRVEDASEHVIDLKELTKTNQTLEEICAELGILKK